MARVASRPLFDFDARLEQRRVATVYSADVEEREGDPIEKWESRARYTLSNGVSGTNGPVRSEPVPTSFPY